MILNPNKSKGALAGRMKGWFAVLASPQFYWSRCSGVIHRVRYAETFVDDKGTPARVSVTYWCGGLGSVSSDKSKTKGLWIEAETSSCERCSLAFNKHKNRHKTQP